MSQNIDIRKLGAFAIIGLGIIFAYFAGNYVADEDYGPLFIVIGGVAAALIFFGLGRRLYLLIPICWGLTGKIGVLPIPFNIGQLVVLASSAYFFGDIIFQKRTKKAPFGMIDLWIWINLLYLVSVFFRNPVGFAFLGSGGRVGGMPYVNVLLATFAYLILNRVRITPEYARKLPMWVLAVAAFSAFAGGVAMFAPQVGLILGRVYSAFAPVNLMGDITIHDTRFGFLQTLGTTLVIYVVAQTNPLSLIHPRHFFSLCLYLSAQVMILLSGFRNAIVTSILYTVFAVSLRDRFMGVVKITLAFTFILSAAITLSFMNINIPWTAQRALCFLPGNWDQDAVRDAQGSSEWRFEMWRIALSSDKYIHNKIFGDGFGFLRADFERGIDMMSGKGSLKEGEAEQEMFLLDGDFHSGPVGSIRFVGYVGLALLFPLFFFLIRMAWRLSYLSLGTKYETCVLFYCIPIIILPIFFLFVFGDYRQDLVEIIVSVGIMNSLKKSIEESAS